jgi:hypothetical protein
MRVSLFRTRCRFFVLCLDSRSTRNRSRDQSDTFSQRPKFQIAEDTNFVSTLSSSSRQRLNYSFSEQEQQQRDSLSLSLSLLRSHRHVRSRFVRAPFALKCEGHKCLFPSSKGRKNYYLGCLKNPKLTSRKKRGWTRDLFFPPQSIFSSSSKSSTSTTTCRQHQLLYSTTTTVAFTRL